jgi:hypothetical protein
MILDKREKDYEWIGCELNNRNLPNIEKLREKKFIDETTKKFNINFEKFKGISELKVRIFFQQD